MARLIDADALLKDIISSADMGGALGKVVECVKYYAKYMVASAPTIEKRKTGKWIKHAIGHEHTPWGFDCSECGEWFVVGEEVIKKYNYCPNCGARTKEE